MHYLVPVLLLSVVLAVMSDAAEKEKRDKGCSKDACPYHTRCLPRGARISTYCISKKCVDDQDGFAKWITQPGTDKGCERWGKCIAYGDTVKINVCQTKVCIRDENGDAKLVFAEGSATKPECVDKFGKCGYKNGDEVVIKRYGYEMLCTCITSYSYYMYGHCNRI